MSSPSDFSCHWQPSRRLLWGYLLIQLAVAVAIGVSAAPLGLKALGVLLAALHAAWVLPRHLLLQHSRAWRGVRHCPEGWQLWNAQSGWQPIQLRPDSLALPGLIVLRYRRPGQWFSRGLCLLGDALPEDSHRRLRVRLRFSRHRWQAPE